MTSREETTPGTATAGTETRPSAAGPAPIELIGLTHDYGARVALRDLSFQVRQGEIFGLLGPNGSGKTTLFRILSTLMVPTGGQARVAGFDVATQPDQVRQLTGVVFQASSLDARLTVTENLTHQGHLYGLHGASLHQRAQEVLARVGLTDRANEMAGKLSGGQQRRVELAKGLIHSPKVLLLDEPSTGLDPGARRDLWQYLRILRDKQGISVLVTTHLMEEAEHCDRLAILNHGKLVALGTPAELKAEIGGDVVQLDAESPYAATLLSKEIERRFQVKVSVVGHTVRVEREQGHRFVTDVVEAFPGQIEGFSVAKPTLEDVFIEHTGHRFWTDLDNDDSKNKERQ